MTVVYFKTGASSPVELRCSRGGKIDFAELGRIFKLVPKSILLNGVRCSKQGLKSEDTWEEIKADLVKEGEPLGEKDCPVVVTGESAVSTGTARECAQTGPAGFKDRSEHWIKHMMLPRQPALPRNVDDLKNILFPEDHGKLPVNLEGYHKFQSEMPPQTKEFMIEADGSVLPTHLTSKMHLVLGPSWSEMDLSMFIGSTFKLIFSMFDTYGQDKFAYDSISGTTKDRSKPDTILTAAESTFLVGVDKFDSLTTAEEDLRSKFITLSSMFYGNVECILGYVAAGQAFQWLFIGKNGQIKKAGPSLNLATRSSRCEFLLSISYAYQLIRKMSVSVPDVPGRRGMFTENIVGDREIAFRPQHVIKSIKHFSSFCHARMTRLEWILEAYGYGQTCPSLPRIRKVGRDYVDQDTYQVEISPIGCIPKLDTVNETRMYAKNVCEALSVLHEAGLVHRDIRPPNILQVSKEQFMLIDLETVAESPFELPEGFQYFKDWASDMLEGRLYTPMSDMYQLGRILRDLNTTKSAPAMQFVEKLIKKQYTADLALRDPWLS